MCIKKFLLFEIFKILIVVDLAVDLVEVRVADLAVVDLVEEEPVGGGNTKKYKSRHFLCQYPLINREII
jgi:hypothetical protein